MIKNILLHYPKEASSAKLYFPQYLLDYLNWKVDTPLTMKEDTKHGFGITIYRNMSKGNISSYLSNAPFYTAPYIHLRRSKNIGRTYPVLCSHLISNVSYPPMLHVMLPQSLRMVFYEPMFEESDLITA